MRQPRSIVVPSPLERFVPRLFDLSGVIVTKISEYFYFRFELKTFGQHLATIWPVRLKIGQRLDETNSVQCFASSSVCGSTDQVIITNVFGDQYSVDSSVISDIHTSIGPKQSFLFPY